jgi:uncharacterized membrane protein
VRTIRYRLAAAFVIGVAVGLLNPVGPAADVMPRLLVGFIAAGLAFAVPLLATLLRFDSVQTSSHVEGEDPGTALSDVIVLTAAVASVAGVGDLLVGGSKVGANHVVDAFIGVGTVAVAWLCTHTVYTVRYARIYYADQTPCIDFHQEESPRYSDFAYFAFNLGMAYQVSDTELRTSSIRRTVLGHCLLAYLFGTVIIASTINLVVGLRSTG